LIVVSRIIAGAPMLRLGAFFVVLCMVLVAASLGVVLYLALGLSGTESTVVALTALTALLLYNTVKTRLRDRSDVGAQIADLSRGSADLARQVAELGRRTEALETERERLADRAAEKARAVTEPLAAELGVLGTLVKQLAETTALIETKLARNTLLTAEQSGAAAPPADAATEAASGTRRPRDPARLDREMVETVLAAIDANRVDLYLQPIVTLPQRKVRYYEAFTRLRTADGTLLQPAEFLEPAEAGGLMARIDHMLLLRCVQVVRRLQLKNREIGLFCNIAASTLNDPRLFPQMLQFMDANRALAPSLVLEFKQSMLRALGPLETESLAALRELGFRFCMDGLTDLRMEPRDLGERGIRYVKVPAALLLDQARAPGIDIHAADLSDLLGRHGISLIAERIEAELQVVNLLDYDVRFGQGFLFSPPRPVRAEALQGVADFAEPAARGSLATAHDKAPPKEAPKEASKEASREPTKPAPKAAGIAF
jgi:cyclic-di-GMP phosphodiesterase TipF (flagellum assembly factor)